MSKMLFRSLLFFLSLVASQALTYRVQPKDTLWKIARQHKVSVENLKALNELHSDVITEGQKLILYKEVSNKSPKKRSQSTAETQLFQRIRTQVLLDWAGFMPGAIDGNLGHFTSVAQKLCPPKTLKSYQYLKPTRTISFRKAWNWYVNKGLPLTSAGHPDFKKLTIRKEAMLYASMAEMIGERFHCTSELLQKLNPGVDLEQLHDGQSLIVPNVETFRVESYYSASRREGLWSNKYGKGQKGTFILIERAKNLLTLRDKVHILSSFPITVNKVSTPLGARQIELIAPGPSYKNKEGTLELLAGPNSPVGVLWCAVGDGIGIHGTNDPDRIGRNSSGGCVRLANWDIVRLARIIRKGTPVYIVEKMPEP